MFPWPGISIQVEEDVVLRGEGLGEDIVVVNPSRYETHLCVQQQSFVLNSLDRSASAVVRFLCPLWLKKFRNDWFWLGKIKHRFISVIDAAKINVNWLSVTYICGKDCECKNQTVIRGAMSRLVIQEAIWWRVLKAVPLRGRHPQNLL